MTASEDARTFWKMAGELAVAIRLVDLARAAPGRARARRPRVDGAKLEVIHQRAAACGVTYNRDAIKRLARTIGVRQAMQRGRGMRRAT